jgi:hypothetical protein
MNIFTWLLLGHLLGDWVLQNDWMARGKKRGLLTLAGMTHFTIYTLTLLTMLWLAGVMQSNPTFYIGLSLAIFASHWLVDATDVVERWMNFYCQSKVEIVRIMVDQTLHLAGLALLVLVFWGK